MLRGLWMMVPEVKIFTFLKGIDNNYVRILDLS